MIYKSNLRIIEVKVSVQGMIPQINRQFSQKNWGQEPEYNLILFEKKDEKTHIQMGLSRKIEKKMELDVKEKKGAPETSKNRDET